MKMTRLKTISCRLGTVLLLGPLVVMCLLIGSVSSAWAQTQPDTTPPIITVDPITITLEAGSTTPDLLDGVSTDDDSIVTTTGTVDVNVPGTYPITYHSVGSANNAADTVTRTYTVVDTTAPEDLRLNVPLSPTSNNSLTVTGTAEAGSTLVLTHNDKRLELVPVDGDGTWSVDLIITETNNHLTVVVTDGAGNSSDASGFTFDILEADTTAPAQPTILQPTTPTTNNSLTVTGTAEAGSSLVLVRNGVIYDSVTVDSDGNWSVDVTLAEKQNTFIATATDSSGNKSPQSNPAVVRLDTTPPPTPRITTAPDTVTSSPFTINGGFTGIGIVVRLFNGDTLVTTTNSNDVGNFSFTVPLNEGKNTFTVTATDGVGNTSVKSNSVTVILKSPGVLSVIITTADTTVNTESFTIRGTSNSADIVALYIGGSHSGTTTIPDGDGNWSFDVTLNEGENILGAIVSSVGGFPIAFTDDITITLYIIPPPSVTLTTTDTSVNDKSFTIRGTSTNADLVTLNVNGANTGITTSPDSDGNWDFGVILNEGENVLGATVSGAGGTASTNNITVILDVTPPTITVDPITVTLESGSTSPDLLDGVSVNDDSIVTATGSVNVGVVGTYTISYQSTDLAGNTSDTISRTYTIIDTMRPDAPTITQPTSPTNDTSLSITGTGEIGSSLVLTLNSITQNPVTVDSDGNWSVEVTLNEGENTFTSTVTDSADNESDSSAPVTVFLDTTAPAQPTIILPDTPTTNNSLTITGTAEAGSTLVLSNNSITQNPVTVDSDGNWSVEVTLNEGENTFTSTVTDSADNESDSSAPVTVFLDTTAPAQPTIILPDTPTTNNSLTITGTAEAGSTLVLSNNSITQNPVTVDSDGNWSVEVTLNEGENTFTSTVTDSADNESDSSAPVTVFLDTTAPAQPTIILPDTPTTNNSLTITGTAEAGSTLVLSNNSITQNPVTVDSDGNWSVEVTLNEGENIFTATATDGVGNESVPSVSVIITLSSFEDLNMDINTVILPEMARAMASGTVSAIAQRIGRAGSAPRSVAVGGQSSLAGALSAHGKAMAEDRLDSKKMLAGSGFTLPLNAGDGATGRSSLALWGSGEYRNLSGKSHNIEWDGDLTGAHLGFDARIAKDVLAGLAVSWLNGDLDYKDRIRKEAGDYEIDLVSAHPYIGWRAGQLDLWATVGYSNGEVAITRNSGVKHSSDINQRTIGVGGSGKLWQGGASRLRLKGEALQTAMEVEGGAGIAKQDVDATRLRMTAEASQSRVLAGGGVFEPSVEAGVRYDGGDGETGSGAEVGGRLSYRNPATGVTAEGRVRALLGHSGGYEEWGVQGSLALQPGADGQGLSFSLSPGYGDSGGGVQQLWRQGLPAESVVGAADYSARLDARLGYGLSLRERDGVLTPYGGMTLGTTDSYRIGLNWKAGSRFDLNLVGERREPSAAAVEHIILLKGGVRF